MKRTPAHLGAAHAVGRGGARCSQETLDQMGEPVTSLSFWCYQSPLGANAGSTRLRRLEDRRELEVLDAVIVTWARGAHVPRTLPVRDRPASQRWKPSVLGGLFADLTAGAPTSQVEESLRVTAEEMAGTGVDEAFLRQVVDHLAPGKSALVVLSGAADEDAVQTVVQRGLARGDVIMLRAELSPDGPARLQQVLQPRRSVG